MLLLFCLLGVFSIQTEADGNGVLHVHRLSILHSWRPVRHGIDDTQAFFVQQRVDGPHDTYVADAAVFLDYECDDNATLDVFLHT